VRANRKQTVATLVGIALVAALAGAIRAQSARTSPAYIIAEVETDPTKTQDTLALRRYAEEAPKTLLPFGGQYVVRGSRVETLEGDAPKGYIVIIRFDSIEKARGWYSSPAYAAIRGIRQNATRSRILLVQGVAPN
jgi:uncharacterized protein (DUF1330 family)